MAAVEEQSPQPAALEDPTPTTPTPNEDDSGDVGGENNQHSIDNEIIDSPGSLCGALPLQKHIDDLRNNAGGIISHLKKRSSTSDLINSASLYDPHLYLCGAGTELDDGASEVNVDEEPIPASDISNPNRNICVVTTAALPWRTGTAVNPLLRALYLVKYQNECREKKRLTDNNNAVVERSTEEEKDEKGGSVVLVIPWLESLEDRIKLYGQSNSFTNSDEQEEWIRSYSATACQMPLESQQLKIFFYPAFYLSGFGSIFPKVNDLCNFIPRELGIDIAILEEPEHLNWFRMANVDNGNRNGDEVLERGEEEIEVEGRYSVEEVELTTSETFSYMDGTTDAEGSNDSSQHASSSSKQKKKKVDKAKLGWTHRFHFVVGIVHTNYEEYARQYGIGASLIAAPAIGAVSALTIRAYCHQVIKLSDTLPSFAPGKELTCNVHGVRNEFLEGVDLNVLAVSSSTTSVSGDAKNNSGDGKDNDDEPSPVYFIGKLVWAKGFDLMLEVQNIFRKRHGDYFHIDIYGGGPDEKAIARAFHGRNHTIPTKRPSAPTSKESMSSPSSSSHPVNTQDVNAAAVLANPQSIKDQSNHVVEQMRRHSLKTDSDDVVSQYLSLGFEVSSMTGSATYVKESRRRLAPEGEEEKEVSANPLDILGDLSGKSMDTGVKTSQAVYNIADASIKNILTMSFSQLKHPLKARMLKKKEERDQDEAEELEEKPKFVFDPPASRFEWRRHPIPAKFPGVVDHAQLKNIPHKIFFNPSTSEVLCTTTAEALAMNKFVIIPKHPSNDFFMQFTNCLSYDTLDECAEKIAWALENIPTTMSDEERRKFTWQAATERLVESSIVTVKQARERAENGMDKTDARIAYWLSESGEKSSMLRNLFNKNDGGDHSSVLS